MTPSDSPCRGRTECVHALAVVIVPLLQEGIGEVTSSLILLIISQFMEAGNFSYLFISEGCFLADVGLAGAEVSGELAGLHTPLGGCLIEEAEVVSSNLEGDVLGLTGL